MIAVWVVIGLWALGEIGLQLTQRLRSGRTTSSEWGSYGVIVIVAVAGVLLAELIRRTVPALDFAARRAAWPTVIAVVIAVGAGFRLWSIIALGKYFRAVVHLQEGHQVVRTGPYRVLRHPSYTGLLVATLGVGLLFANLGSTVVFELLVIAAVGYRIRIEEKVLLGGLGDAYRDYMRETSRLIPHIW